MSGLPNPLAFIAPRFRLRRQPNSPLGQCGFDQFDPVPDRGSAGTVEMGLTADIGRDNDVGVAAFQCIEFMVAQLSGQFWLGQ